MTAKDLLQLHTTIILLDISENIIPSLRCHIDSTAVVICPAAIPNHSPIVSILVAVRRFESSSLLEEALRHLVKGQWTLRLSLNAWSGEERHDVGTALWDLLQYLTAVVGGIRASGKLKVVLVGGKSATIHAVLTLRWSV